MLRRLFSTATATAKQRVALNDKLASNCGVGSSSPAGTSSTNGPAVNLEKIFTLDAVQNLLKTLTGCDPTKIFRQREVSKLENPKYMLMTEEDIKQMEAQVASRCQQRLRMPPFKYPLNDETQILRVDKEIAGFDNTKFIFTDIDPEVHPRDRIVVVREIDGTLRTATPDEKDRMNRVYFPKTGQQVHTPEIFKEPYLTEALNKQTYEFLLDWACTQFEPDDATFSKITKRIFDHINKHQHWSALYSTRYYGNLIFYMVTEKVHERLLCTFIKSSNLHFASCLIHLYYLCHPKQIDAPIDQLKESDYVNFITNYIKNDAVDKKACQLALDSYLYSKKT